MIVKCPNNIILDIPDSMRVVICPNECPKRNKCNKSNFVAIKAKGKPQLIVSDNPVVSPNVEEPSQIVTEPVVNTNESPNQSNVSNRFNQILNKTTSQESAVSNRFNNILNRKPVENVNITSANDEYVELENSKKIIIYIGSKNYYAPIFAKKQGFLSIDVALLEIFKHWNTDVVFSGENNFTKSFIDVLKLKFKEKHKDVIDDVLGRSGNVNSKFYHLFYDHIYKGSSISGKFYFANGYQPIDIRPIFIDENDLYRHIYDRYDFMNNFCGCDNELLNYLNISSMTELLKRAVKYINYQEQKIGLFKMEIDSRGRNYPKYISLDSSSNFMSNLYKIESIEKLENKIEFFKNYEMLSNGEVIDRNTMFVVPDIVGIVDDGVYDLLDISKVNSSQAKDVLKLYLTLVREYIKICEPEEIKFGSVLLSVSNFYNQLEQIIHNAYSKCIGNYTLDDDIKKLFLISVLKENNILNYFVKQCNTSKINVLLDLIKPKVIFSDYINSEISSKKVFYNGKLLEIEKQLMTWYPEKKYFESGE